MQNSLINEKNYIGVRFGRLLAKERIVCSGRPQFLCVCDCGKSKAIFAKYLANGDTTSCGCSRTKLFEMLGKKFGKLEVLSLQDKTKCGKLKYLCRCECGKLCTVKGASLRTGETTSCGCFRHGMLSGGKKNKIYSLWAGMKARCLYPSNRQYRYYGARGIKVCKRWMKFKNFFSDMGHRPPGMTLDRIDVNGDYCPENCKWSTKQEQSRNKNTTRKITHDSKTLTVAEWSSITGLKAATINNRIRRGWSIEEVLTTPSSYLKNNDYKSTYSTWCAMKQRCDNPNHASYHRYGGRGIKYCEEWRVFSNFYKSMGLRPKGFSLDRIDSDGPYCPSNCRWATTSEQGYNKKTIKTITFKDKTLTFTQWSLITGLPASVLRTRLKHGWSIERMLTTPKCKRNDDIYEVKLLVTNSSAADSFSNT